MTPHIALTIPEIISEIFKNVAHEYCAPHSYESNEGKQSRRDLLSGALSCKAFMNPCLDLLWNTMVTILPLLKLIPEMEEIDGQLAILGELDLQKLTLLYTYAHRVRHYISEGSPQVRVEPSTCLQLSQLEHGLLPALISIEIVSNDDPTAHLCLLPSLLRSTLISSFQCELTDSSHDQVLGSFLSMLIKRTNTQNLRCLMLRGTLSVAYGATLSRLHSLQSLTLTLSSSSWTFDIIQTIARLQLIDIHLDFDTAEPAPSETIPPNSFSMLTTLSLAGKMPWIFYILDSITSGLLKSINVHHYSYDQTRETALDYSRLYQCLQRFPLLCDIGQSTGELAWYIAGGFQLEPSESISIIHPFLGFVHLRSLQVRILQPWFHISNDDISAVVSALPLLEALRLCTVLPRDVVRPTVSSLFTVATKCTHLTELSITLDMDSDTAMLSLLPIINRPGSCQLQGLDLQHTKISNFFLTARLLDCLFPNLKRVTTWGRDIAELGHIIFLLCQPVRAVEKRRNTNVLPRVNGALLNISSSNK